MATNIKLPNGDITNRKKLEILSQTNIGIKDICALYGVSQPVASKIKKSFEDWAKKNNTTSDRLPNGGKGLRYTKIPTQLFLKWANIDLKLIENFARLEKEGII